MSLLSLSQVSFGYACGELLFEDATFSINPGDRLAVVGPNGSGKSTLLRLLAGEGEPSGGQIARRRGLTVAFGGQEAAAGARQSLFDFAFGVVPDLAACRARLAALESELSQTAAATEYAGLIDDYQA